MQCSATRYCSFNNIFLLWTMPRVPRSASLTLKMWVYLDHAIFAWYTHTQIVVAASSTESEFNVASHPCTDGMSPEFVPLLVNILQMHPCSYSDETEAPLWHEHGRIRHHAHTRWASLVYEVCQIHCWGRVTFQRFLPFRGMHAHQKMNVSIARLSCISSVLAIAHRSYCRLFNWKLPPQRLLLQSNEPLDSNSLMSPTRCW